MLQELFHGKNQQRSQFKFYRLSSNRKKICRDLVNIILKLQLQRASLRGPHQCFNQRLLDQAQLEQNLEVKEEEIIMVASQATILNPVCQKFKQLNFMKDQVLLIIKVEWEASH